MAKSAEKTKTQSIQEYLARHPGAAPKTVAEALRAEGVDVSPNYVSTIKTNMKGKKKKGKKRAAKKVGRPPKKAASDKVSIDALLEAKKLAAKLGGIEKAKEALGALAQLVD